MGSLVVIDASYEGMVNIDYQAAKNSGVDGVILRAGFGSDETQIDSRFREAYDKAIAAGLLVGAYWMNYFRSNSDAVTEASVCHTAIDGLDLQLGIYADYEEDTIDYMDRCGGSKEDMTGRIVSFIQRLIELGHGRVRFYTNTNCMNGTHGADALDMTRLVPYGFWHAHYNGDENTTEPGTQVDGVTVVGHQFANNDQKPSWIQGCPNVDVSIFDEATTLDEQVQVDTTPVQEAIPEPVVEESPVNTGTYTVKAGDTLSQIAVDMGTDVDTLVSLNGIPDPDKIDIGQVLVLPWSVPNDSAPAERETYTVVDGDTLSDIANAHGISLSDIINLNPQIPDPDKIYAGNLVYLS